MEEARLSGTTAAGEVRVPSMRSLSQLSDAPLDTQRITASSALSLPLFFLSLPLSLSLCVCVCVRACLPVCLCVSLRLCVRVCDAALVRGLAWLRWLPGDPVSHALARCLGVVQPECNELCCDSVLGTS